MLIIRAAAYASDDLRASSRPASRNMRNVNPEVVGSTHNAGQSIGLHQGQPGDDLLRVHEAPPPDRRRRRTTSTAAETSSSRRIRFRVDAVRAAPGALTLGDLCFAKSANWVARCFSGVRPQARLGGFASGPPSEWARLTVSGSLRLGPLSVVGAFGYLGGFASGTRMRWTRLSAGRLCLWNS